MGHLRGEQLIQPPVFFSVGGQAQTTFKPSLCGRQRSKGKDHKSFAHQDNPTTMNDDDCRCCFGWSKDDVKPQLFPYTRDGMVQLYSKQRRWIQLSSGWSRIGEDEDGQKSNQFSHRVSSSSTGSKIVEDSDDEARAVRGLVAQLCEQGYKNGWATGTSGGVCIRVGGPKENRPWRVFVAPSGIQKEDMIGDDVFELDMERNVVVPPRSVWCGCCRAPQFEIKMAHHS